MNEIVTQGQSYGLFCALGCGPLCAMLPSHVDEDSGRCC